MTISAIVIRVTYVTVITFRTIAMCVVGEHTSIIELYVLHDNHLTTIILYNSDIDSRPKSDIEKS